MAEIETVKITRILLPRIVVEDGEGFNSGDLIVWARFDDYPELSAPLATVHYHRAYQHNGNRRDVAEELRLWYEAQLCPPAKDTTHD